MSVKADITIDIDKQVGELQNLTQIYNARVGDNKTPLTIAWRKNDLPLNLKGLHAYIVGKTGDGSYNSETGKIDFPINTPVSQFEDDGSGTLDGGQSGLTTLLIPKQMWQNSGLFAGYIGLKSEDGSVFTSKDIWFKVLGNVLDAGVEINYFIGDFDKALAEAEKKLQDKADSFDQATAQALQDLHDKYLQKTQEAEDTLGDTQASIDSNIASLKTLSSEIESLIAKLKDSDVIGTKQYDNDMDNLKYLVENKLANMSYTPEAFPTAKDIQNTYPHGKAGIMLAVDTGHKWVYYANSWQDCGVYQGVELGDKAVDDVASKLSEKTGNYWSIQTPNFNSANLQADNQAYLLARKYPAGFVKNIQLKVDTPTDAQLFIFKYDRENLVDPGLMITLTHEFQITSDTVTINQEIDHPFLIGIKCAGAYWSRIDNNVYNVLGLVKVGESYNFPINQTSDTLQGIEFAFRVNYNYFENTASTVENVPTLNYKEPSYSDDVYPLVFDFTTNKAKIDAMFLANNGLIDYFTLVDTGVLSLDLPPLENTNIKQNYFLIVNGNELKVVKYNGVKFIKDYPGNWKIIAGFCVCVDSDIPKKLCYIYSGINTDLVKIIFHTPQSDNPRP